MIDLTVGQLLKVSLYDKTLSILMVLGLAVIQLYIVARVLPKITGFYQEIKEPTLGLKPFIHQVQQFLQPKPDTNLGSRYIPRFDKGG